jgi:hypothetical protein
MQPYPRRPLQARIAVLQQQVKEAEFEIDAFSFELEERKILREVVEDIESKQPS